MFIQAVIEHLENNGLGVFGTNIFGSLYPSNAPDACTLVKVSAPPELSKDLPTQIHGIQILTRAANTSTTPGYVLADKQAQDILKLFHAEISGSKWLSKHNYIIGNTTRYYVFSSRALQLPIDISPDEKGRSEFSINMQFKIRL